MNPWLMLLGIVFVGVVFVVIPAVWYTYSLYRRPRLLRCPSTGTEARVTVAPGRAAASAAFGKAPEVERCSLWPKLGFCRQECLSVPIDQTRAARSSWTPVPRARLQKILVPLDGSPGSESVLWTVAQLARAQGARGSRRRWAGASGRAVLPPGFPLWPRDQPAPTCRSAPRSSRRRGRSP